MIGLVFPVSAQSPAAKSESLPPKWNEAVTTLAGKIVAVVGTTWSLSLEMRNISSLGAADASRIELALEEELKQRGMQVVTSTRAGADVNVTLSEGVDGLVWVAGVNSGAANRTFIVEVPRQISDGNRQPNFSLSLEAHLIWWQPKKFLDFKQFTNSVTFSSTLVVVEPGTLEFFRTNGLQWQLWRTIPISHSTPWPRDARGAFDSDGTHVYVPGLRCSGDFEQAAIECAPLNLIPVLGGPFIYPKVSGLDEWVESTGVWDKCGDSSILLATGGGDWTKSDSMQAYLYTDYVSSTISSGSPVNFEGPVVALRADGKGSAARAVVHNLKTGNYEAYIVTATCSH